VSASARPLLDRTGISSFFSAVITGDEVERGKPHPDIYLRAADKLGISAEACLVIEDSLAGMAAGKAANMRVAAIPDRRFVDPQEYEKKADYVLGSLSEIPNLLRQVNAVASEAHALQ
jgi:beta-phosphoglucomutase-like phosphatase (HAD superfamily)